MVAVGTQIGPYKIIDHLGKGGMGEVYRASDSKLGREVAIKVLPDDLARDPDRLARFEREARLLASLNHPLIATIHGLESDNGVSFLVMELVPGRTLAERLLEGPLPITEALTIACQVAESLEAAHEKGIIHRDLKPANVQVMPSGSVKLLDFGLAKPLSIDSPETQLYDAGDATRPGVILGTPAYMSPEQARGKALDRRTDIWSFGCLLYEALAGRKTFPGETPSDVLAAVLEREPDLSLLPEATPPAVRTILQRCLNKDPNRRLRDIGEARLVLEEATGSVRAAAIKAGTATQAITPIAPRAGQPSVMTVIADPTPPPPPRRRRRVLALFSLLVLAAALVVVVVFGGLALFGHGTSLDPRPRPPHSVAVLPVQMADPDLETVVGPKLPDILAGGLTAKLSQSPRCRVTSQTVIESHRRIIDDMGKGKDKGPAQPRIEYPWRGPMEAGQSLSVDYVIVIKVTVVGGAQPAAQSQYVMDMEMIEVRSGAVLWGEQFQTNVGLKNAFGEGLTIEYRRSQFLEWWARTSKETADKIQKRLDTLD